MARPFVLVKLGGSLITDKTRAGVARHAAIRRLALELAAVARNPRAPRLLLGHGSGSFGHAAAADGGLTRGADATRRLDAIVTTQRRAADLHRVVVAALAEAGARPFSLAPSSFLYATNGRVGGLFADPVFAALDRGLLPVVYGDVVLDRRRGAVIVSTEEVFLILAKDAARRRRPIARAIWLGETDGVADAGGRTIARLSPASARRLAGRVVGAAGVDVTGGMALRLRAAAALAGLGAGSAIVDGRKAGAMAAALAGRGPGGDPGRSTVRAMANLGDLLEKTSRTFALSIPMLPEPTRRHVGIAYLLFRVADTFEDAALWPRAKRLAALDDLAQLLETQGGEQRASARWVADAPVAHAGYLELLRESPAVMEAYWSVPASARAVLRRELLRTVSGMAGFVRRGDAHGNLRLASLSELREYCYVVAGIVGEMLTELFLLDAESLAPYASPLRRRSRFFGEGLQLVNILKDANSDATEGRLYLPHDVERARVFALARRDLDVAAAYVGILQLAGAPDGFVAFTGSPAVLARASLDRIESQAAGAKLTRAEVGTLMERMFENLAAGRRLL